MINEAIKKITDEMMQLQEKDPFAVPVEEHLTAICTNEDVAGKILQDGKTLKGAIDALWTEAKKRKTGNSAVISSDEAFKIVDDYFGINSVSNKMTAAKIDVMDLL